MEPKGIRKHVTEPENEFIGLENIASETLVKMSECAQVEIPRSIRTIQEQSRYTVAKDIRVTESIGNPKKWEIIGRNNHIKVK